MAVSHGHLTGLSWTIDALANRTSQNVTGGTCSAPQFTVTAKNQISATGFGYDADGNLNLINTVPIQYDAENRLTNVNGVTYVYDANGRRIEKMASSWQIHYFYDEDGHVILEVNQSDQGIKAYEYMAGQHVAEYTGQTSFVHTDHLGSTRTVTNYAGSVTDKMDYLPYGEQIAGGTSTTHKFTGYERDGETGFDYAQARYYDSGLGRFMSPDPTGIFLGNLNDPQSLNLYAYVRNNPVNLVDPLGLCTPGNDASGTDIVCSDPLDGLPDWATFGYGTIPPADQGWHSYCEDHVTHLCDMLFGGGGHGGAGGGRR